MVSIVEVDHVSKFFTDRTGRITTALDDVSLGIQKGEIVSIVGQTGSGKTTFGRITVGLSQPSKGMVRFEGEDIASYKQLKELWKKAQMIHQDPYSSLDQYLTVREVLDRPLRYLLEIRDAKEREETIAETLRMSGLPENSMDKRISELSGGERQRISVSRAFIINPLYVVADEPTTMVDAVHRNEILNQIINFKNAKNASILIITHDISIAIELSNRIAIIHNGKILEVSDVESIKRSSNEYTQSLFKAIQYTV